MRDLVGQSENELLNVKRFSARTVAEVKAFLESNRLSLRPDDRSSLEHERELFGIGKKYEKDYVAATNARTSLFTLRKLAKHPLAMIRYHVAQNKGITIDIVLLLAKDSDGLVQGVIQWRLKEYGIA